MSLLARVRSSVSVNFRRNIGFSAILAQKGQASDPIQKLFVTKIKEYDSKSKSLGPGKFVDSNAEIEKELKSELDRVSKIFGGGAGVDMTKFPEFKFTEPELAPINQQQS